LLKIKGGYIAKSSIFCYTESTKGGFVYEFR